MKGYIYLQTYSDKPGQVRVLSQDEQPIPQQTDDGISIRYIAKFKNAHIAYMHIHNTLKKKLEDINTRFYTVSLPEAIAAIEAEDLAYERIWIDPELSEDELQLLDLHTSVLQKYQQRTDRIYLVIGGIGLLLLLLILLGGVWHV